MTPQAASPALTTSHAAGRGSEARERRRRLGTAVPVAWLLARRGDARSAVLLLPLTAFALMTTLVLTVLAGAVSFLRWDDELAGLYQLLAALAVVLLLVPLLSLGGVAARLSARRRDERLATLRLLGATTWTVTRLTVLESVVVALGGALAGVAGYLLIGPGVQRITFRGEPIGSAYWLPAWAVAAVVAAVMLLAALSAVAGLGQVNVSPLGVRRRQHAPRLGWLRAVAGIVIVLAAVLAMQGSYQDAAVAVGVVLGAFAAGIGVLNLVGPWVVGLIARVQVRRARRPAQLLAARAMAESPKAVWRQVSGVVMTCFIAVVAGSGVAMLDQSGSSASGAPAPGAAGDPLEAYLLTDIRTGIFITIAAAFVMVACSAGVTQAADVLDRAPLYRSLDKLGMPRHVMVAAQVRTVMLPLVVVSAGSIVLSGLLVLPLVGIALVVAPLSLLLIAACLAAGMLLVHLGTLVARPMLHAALAAS